MQYCKKLFLSVCTILICCTVFAQQKEESKSKSKSSQTTVTTSEAKPEMSEEEKADRKKNKFLKKMQKKMGEMEHSEEKVEGTQEVNIEPIEISSKDKEGEMTANPNATDDVTSKPTDTHTKPALLKKDETAGNSSSVKKGAVLKSSKKVTAKKGKKKKPFKKKTIAKK